MKLWLRSLQELLTESNPFSMKKNTFNNPDAVMSVDGTLLLCKICSNVINREDGVFRTKFGPGYICLACYNQELMLVDDLKWSNHVD